MALDAIPSGETSNSYFTVAEGDAFAAEHVDGALWSALATSADKEKYAITASRDVNGLCLTGVATVATQALAVPRTGWTQYGQPIGATVIPATWKYAVFEYALHLIRFTAARRETDADAQGLTKLKVGSVELGFKATAVTANTVTTKLIPDAVRRILPASWLCDDAQVYFEFEAL